MKVEMWEQRLPGYVVRGVGEVFVGEKDERGFEINERVVREYAGHCEVYLEALAVFERAVDEAREAERAPDVAAPEVE